MRWTTEDFRARGERWMHQLRGMVRRVTVAVTSSAGFWGLQGYKDKDGNREPFPDVEVFNAVGFGSRPRDGKGEAVIVMIGGENGHPVVIASRDKEIQVSLDKDETAIFTSKGVVKITKDGIVELGGTGLGITDGVVHGTGVDPFTGSTYYALGSTSSKARAKK